MKTSTSFGLTLSMDGGEYIKPSVTYTDIDLTKEFEPQLVKQREAASKMLDNQLKLLVEKVSSVSGKTLEIDAISLMMEMAKKLEELESGLIAITQKISEREVRKESGRTEPDGDRPRRGRRSRGTVLEQGLPPVEETEQPDQHP